MKLRANSPSPVELAALLAQGMGLKLHWFPADVSPTRLAVVMAGMANTEGGVIVLGITPRSAHLQGVTDVQKALVNIFQAALITDPPLVIPVPQSAEVDKTKIVWITVPAGLPYVYSLEGRYWGREKAQTNPLAARRLRQLLLERGVVQFETQTPPEAVYDDLDPQKVADYLEAINLPGIEHSEQALYRRGCVTKDIRPTYAALLLFSRHPQHWLPNAAILAARFVGTSLANRVVKEEITGTLPDQLRQAEAFLQQHLLRGIQRSSGMQCRDEYPLEAVRELLINAVAHRDYNLQGDTIHLNIFSDRLEIQSPGGLPGPVTLDNLLEARFSRNAVIIQILADLGFVERLGFGLNRVVTLMRQHGFRPPRFEETAGSFRVTLFASQEAPSNAAAPLPALGALAINSRQRLALDYLGRYRRITSRDYQELCPGVHPETLRRDLSELVSQDILIKVGDKRATYYILKK